MLKYRFMLALASPIVMLFFVARVISGKETWAGFGERLGLGTGPVSTKRHIWVHGASLGELTAAKPLIDDMLRQVPDIQIIATANTFSGRDLISRWQNSRITSRLAPLDIINSSARFVQKWRPVAAITLENEIWPRRIFALAQSGAPVVVASGRLSQTSQDKWLRFSSLAQEVMSRISYLAPIDADNGARFLGLGLGQDQLGAVLNLKSATIIASPDTTELAKFSKHFAHSDTVLAASTHVGEEAGIIEAFAAARKQNDQLKLILAPRHPERGDEVGALITQAGLAYSRRSAGTAVAPEHPVFLADTVGEMALWYTLSAATIIGGTFAEKGGHTPFEPIQFGSIIIHGPNFQNHRQAFEALNAVDGAIAVETLSDLAHVFTEDLSQPKIAAMKTQALAAVEKIKIAQSDTTEIIAFLKTALTTNY